MILDQFIDTLTSLRDLYGDNVNDYSDAVRFTRKEKLNMQFVYKYSDDDNFEENGEYDTSKSFTNLEDAMIWIANDIKQVKKDAEGTEMESFYDIDKGVFMCIDVESGFSWNWVIFDYEV